MVTIIIVHIVCNDHLYELFLFFFFAIVTIMVVCIIIYHFSCEIFLSIFLGQQSQFWLHVLLIIVTCIEVFLLVSFFFSFFFWWLPLQSYVLFIMIACDFCFFCLNYNHIFFCYDCLKEIFFSPCCNNCSYTCGHKYHVLGITDMSKVFFSNF